MQDVLEHHFFAASHGVYGVSGGKSVGVAEQKLTHKSSSPFVADLFAADVDDDASDLGEITEGGAEDFLGSSSSRRSRFSLSTESVRVRSARRRRQSLHAEMDRPRYHFFISHTQVEASGDVGTLHHVGTSGLSLRILLWLRCHH